MCEENQLMWTQTPPKPHPPTVSQPLPGENPDIIIFIIMACSHVVVDKLIRGHAYVQVVQRFPK